MDALRIRESGTTATLTLLGNWDLDRFSELMHSIPDPSAKGWRQIVIDGGELGTIDTAGSFALLECLGVQEGGPEIRLERFSARNKSILELVHERLGKGKAPKKRKPSFLASIGRGVSDFILACINILAFIGESAASAVELLYRPRIFRGKELAAHLESALVNAVAIVALVMFLIGVVLAYLFASQVEKYGANIFIVDGVVIALARELSPVIVAIIVAGRSGSAFTAQIGAMKLNEEVEALVTLGLSPMHVLVLPRIAALIVALPILVFVGDFVGIAGGMMIAENKLGVSSATFLERLQVAVPIRHFILGAIKAPVFAIFIAIIGCQMGLRTENNARSIGLATTSTV
ncbi:MAG: ABC transporter permease, partial [Deltaproteobacteria bacterium]|nr:ABC transporter permease [Deltaproteobacteria bacterium]